jgi:biopolymer transport protein ExbD
MRRSIYTNHQAYDEINITSMLDLAWVLLVVFVVAITASVQGIKVNLPKASNTPSLAKSHTKAISIMADGSFYLDAYPVTMEQLESTLRQYKAADPDLPVIVKGDAAVQYQSVMLVLDLLQRLEIHQLGLVTSRLVK